MFSQVLFTFSLEADQALQLKATVMRFRSSFEGRRKVNTLITLLGQLNQKEKDELTSWLSRLSQKEHDSVTSTLAGASVDDVRQILSVAEGQRMSLFSIKPNFLEEVSKGIEEHPVSKEIKRLREEMWDKARNDKWE